MFDLFQITAEQVAEFQQNGAVCLRQVFSPDWVRRVEKGVEKVLQSPSAWSESLSAEGGSGKYFNDYCQWRRIPEFEDYVFNSEAAAIVGQLMQSEEVAFYHEHVLIKEAGTNKKTPWHVDQTYYPINGSKVRMLITQSLCSHHSVWCT
ncbi:hypothetical protein EB796_009058 [Bugula neritina]|uniref:Phytanoyl-CoA dioxygenase n=1 Tax=Bugula neritina TaxID=10212 RepID=A0A7J7K3T5_BUGNE|nr:hypothetical protein EB796_009058 [Bugula neritina]